VTQHGDCVMSLNEDDTLTVQQADPRILISAELLEKIAAGRYHRAVTLTGDADRITRAHQGTHYPDGPDMVLTINAANRKVIYRIAEYLFERDSYVAEWPD
jgi:hypothetical protein